VVYKFKDETAGVPIAEFCGLRSKMYSILLDNEDEKKTGKGIKKSTLKIVFIIMIINDVY
jgi:hypothetical protein